MFITRCLLFLVPSPTAAAALTLLFLRSPTVLPLAALAALVGESTPSGWKLVGLSVPDVDFDSCSGEKKNAASKSCLAGWLEVEVDGNGGGSSPVVPGVGLGGWCDGNENTTGSPESRRQLPLAVFAVDVLLRCVLRPRPRREDEKEDDDEGGEKEDDVTDNEDFAEDTGDAERAANGASRVVDARCAAEVGGVGALGGDSAAAPVVEVAEPCGCPFFATDDVVLAARALEVDCVDGGAELGSLLCVALRKLWWVPGVVAAAVEAGVAVPTPARAGLGVVAGV